MGADVFQEDPPGSDLGDDPGDVGPDPARVGGAAPPSGVALSLARVSRSDEIHDATPRSAVEAGNVVPDSSAIQGLRFHPGHESGRRIGFPLDVTHSAMSGLGDRDPEFEATAPGT